MLETRDYFLNFNIDVVFLFNNFLFYMQNTVQCLHCIRCRSYAIYLQKQFFYVNIWENRYDKIAETD